MKKLLVVMLSLMMAMVMFTACGETSDSDASTMTLKLSDNLPEFSMDGNYTEVENTYEQDGDTEVLWTYKGDDDAEYRKAAAYKWPVGDKSLVEETKADALEYFPVQEPEVITCNYWNEPDDYEYTYYAGVDDGLMYQSWIFQDGDYFYQICVGYDLVKYDVEDSGYEFAVPKQMIEREAEGAIKSFVDPDYDINMSEFPNIDVYYKDFDYDITEENIAKNWGVENVKITEHEYTSNDKNTKIPGYIIECEYTEDGKTLVCYESLMKLNGKYFGMNFSYNKDIEFSEYIENSYRAFLFTVAEKNQ